MEYNWQLQMCLTTIKLFEFGQNLWHSKYKSVIMIHKIFKKWKLCCWRQRSIGKYTSSKNSLHANLQLFNDRILQILHLSRWSHQMIMSVKSRATCARFAVNLHSAFCFKPLFLLLWLYFCQQCHCVCVNSFTVFVSTACICLMNVAVFQFSNPPSVWL